MCVCVFYIYIYKKSGSAGTKYAHFIDTRLKSRVCTTLYYSVLKCALFVLFCSTTQHFCIICIISTIPTI